MDSVQTGKGNVCTFAQTLAVSRALKGDVADARTPQPHIAIVFYLLGILTWSNRFLMWVEDLLVPGLASLPVDNVVFLLGHQRSGTTSLQKSLWDVGTNQGATNFDLLFPSLILKVLMWPLKFIADLIVRAYIDVPGHRAGLSEPLEEHLWLLHHATGEAVPFVMFPSLACEKEVVERAIAVTDRHVRFIRRCIQRVMYWQGRDRVYIGKPLMLTLHIDKLRKAFPEARFVVCVRDPCRCVPSWADLVSSQTGLAPTDKEFQKRFDSVFTRYSLPMFAAIEETVKEAGRQDAKRSGQEGASEPGALTLCRFKEWKSRPQDELSRLCRWMGVEGKVEFKEGTKERHKNRAESYQVIPADRIRREIGARRYNVIMGTQQGAKVKEGGIAQRKTRSGREF